MKLNLGCGRNKIPDFVNVDKEPTCAPDVIFDLEQTPWPWPDVSAEAILATHVMEHLGLTPNNFLSIMKEIHRILIPGGELKVIVPHHCCNGYWGDPTHVRPITPQIFQLFSKKNCQEAKANGWPNTPLADYLDVDFDVISTMYSLTPVWSRRWDKQEITREELDYALETYNNVAQQVTIVMRKAE